MPKEAVYQLGLWPDASFDGNRTRNFRRTPQRARHDYRQVYGSTPQWQCRRSEPILRDKFRCQRCGRERRLQIHHLSYAHLGDEYPSEIVSLCRSCHEKVREEERDVQPHGC